MQRDAKPHFITFVTYQRWEMPGWARSIVHECCVHDHEKHYLLHAAVVMPDHAHLILTPMVSAERAAVFTLAEIMSGIKGTSSHRINRRLERLGRIWQEESFDRVLRSSGKAGRKDRLHPQQSGAEGAGRKGGRLRLGVASSRLAELRSAAQPGAAGPT
ncbi:MAG: transposase [Terriglobales bacterium]